jgi:NodT family efflux transporter outer membrane factor (OMF) lipoprotein
MTRTPRFLFIAFASAWAAACAVGPTYKTPAAPAAGNGAFVSSSPAAVSSQTPPGQWWRLYQDPVLDGLVQRALTENQDLKVAAANLAYAQGLASEARAGLFPTTDLSAGDTYGRSSTGNLLAALTGKKATPAWTGSAGFTAAYQVDLFGRVRRTIEAARADTQAARYAEDAVRVTVVAATTAAYVNACAYAEQAEVARHSEAVIERSYEITLNERSAGTATDLDIDRQAALLDQTRATIPTLDGQHRSALFELAALIGKTPAEVPADAAACKTAPRIAQVLPVGDGAALLRRRPDVSEAERQLAAATARIGAAAADLYPTVSLGGSVSGAGPTAASLTSTSGLSFGVGPLLTWTFPNISVARAHVKESTAQAQAALAGFDSVVLQALKEAEQALTAYAGEIERHTALTSARDHAADALRLANIQYQAGSASGLDLIQAETSAIAADQALAASDQALAGDQVAVFQALGGGWEQAPAVVPPAISKR